MATKTKSKGKSKAGNLNHLQREARDLIRAAERDELGLPPLGGSKHGGRISSRSSRPRRGVRKRVVGVIPRKYTTTRVAAHLVGGIADALWFAGRHTSRGAYIAGRAGVRHAGRKVAERRSAARPPGMEGTQRRRIGGIRAHCASCNKAFATAADMNRHFLDAHAAEKFAPAPKPAEHRIHRSPTARTAGKVIIHPNPRPRNAPTGRHRRTRTAPHRIPASTLVSAYRKDINKIGANIMATATTNRLIAMIGNLVDELPAIGKPDLVETQDIMIGLERFGVQGAESIKVFERLLIKRGVDPAVTRTSFNAMEQAFDEFGRFATRFLFLFQDTYARHVRTSAGSTATTTQMIRLINHLADELPAEGKPTLVPLQEIMAGLERFGNRGSDAIKNLERALNKRRTDPAITRTSFTGMSSALDDVGRNAARFLGIFNEIYALHIAAARNQLSAPNRTFFRAKAS